jgi:chromosome segregation ATPase
VATLQGLIEEERRRHTVSVESIELQWKEVDTRRQELEEEVRALRLQLSEMETIKATNTRMERDKAQLMHENSRLLSQYEEVLRHNNDAQAMIARLKSRDSNGPKNQATVEELQRRLSELPSIRQQLDESKRESYRLREEISALVREKNELESRLAHYAEETRRTLRKDAEFERVVREASSQVKRLDQQIDESAIVVNRRGMEPLLPTTRSGATGSEFGGPGRNAVSTPQTQRNYY